MRTSKLLIVSFLAGLAILIGLGVRHFRQQGDSAPGQGQGAAAGEPLY